ncbi:XRE family transcriptional regulator [Sutcliffiella horikoshii]|uniref:XRE family transcriptional regulator n=1 Tax=Sutcliffiella horikoshii TaxID=79883 RepID=UPI003CF9EAFF
MRIKSNIQELVDKSGLRDKYIRDQLNIQQPQWRNIKKGESYPTVPKVFLLARILDVKVDELYEVIEEDQK